MNIGGNFPPPTYDEAQYLEPISANNVPISQVSPQPYGLIPASPQPQPYGSIQVSPQPYQPYGSIPASPQPYGLGIQLPSITQPQSPSSIPVGASTHLQLLRDPDDSVYGSRTFVNERGELLVDNTPINSVYIKCPRCQQQFVRTQRSSGCSGYVAVIPVVGFFIFVLSLIAQSVAEGHRRPFERMTPPYFVLTGFGIFALSFVVTVIAAVYCGNKMMDDVPQNCPNCRQAVQGGNA